MTVVAAYVHDGYTYLFGDLLLSDLRDDKNSIELPASGHNPSLKVGGNRLSGLRQKLIVIAPYCALGFAGDFENAQRLFDSLKNKAQSTTRLSFDEALADINSASEAATKEGNEFAIVGWYREADGLCRTLRTNAQLHERSSGGHILIAGTGANLFLEAFEKTITDFALYKAQFKRIDPRTHWLFLQSHLIGIEAMIREDSATLAHLVGGGYELISLREEGFYKANDVTVVIWEAICSFKGRPKYTHNAFLAYKMAYVKDALVLRVCSLPGREWDGRDIPARNATTYVALPPCTDPQQPFPEEVESIQMDSQVVCHVVFVYQEDELLGNFLEVEFGSKRGSCQHVKFSQFGVEGKKPFVCEISENRKQSFREGILNIVSGRPGGPSPT